MTTWTTFDGGSCSLDIGLDGAGDVRIRVSDHDTYIRTFLAANIDIDEIDDVIACLQELKRQSNGE